MQHRRVKMTIAPNTRTIEGMARCSIGVDIHERTAECRCFQEMFDFRLISLSEIRYVKKRFHPFHTIRPSVSQLLPTF